MNRAHLLKGYKSLLQTIYNPREYYQRALVCLNRVAADRPEPRSRKIGRDLLTLLRVVLTLGIRDKARREFWRFLHFVLTGPRQKFAEAIRLAAVGYHFRKLTEEKSC